MRNFTKRENGPSKDEIAELLKTSPEALEAFEKAYTIHVLDPDVDTGNLFDMDRRSAKASEDSERRKQADETGEEETEQSDSEQDEKQLVMVDKLVRRIVDELIDQTVLYTYSKKGHGYEKISLPGDHTPVKAEEIYALPKNLQPQLTITKRESCHWSQCADESAVIAYTLQNAKTVDICKHMFVFAYVLWYTRHTRRKRFGKSLQTRAPAQFCRTLKRKLEALGGQYLEVDTRAFRASQYDHVTDTYTKKKLSRRHNIIDGRWVQRDLYSAFLLSNSAEDLAHADRDSCNETFNLFLKNHDACVAKIRNTKTKIPRSFGFQAA